jgi:hypothetical protein
LTLVGKIDAILKVSVIASVLLASSSVGYYYLVYLPQRDAQIEPERALERLRAAAEKRAKQEQLLVEQQASERRAAEQKAIEEQQKVERAARYQACLSRATDDYVCDMAHVVHEASPDCKLPRSVASALDADAEKARDHCLGPDAVDALAPILR